MSISYNPGVVDRSGEFIGQGYANAGQSIAQGITSGIGSAMSSIDNLYKAKGTLEMAKNFGFIDQATLDQINKSGNVVGAAANITPFIAAAAAKKKAEDDARLEQLKWQHEQMKMQQEAAKTADRDLY